jgi:hypothetical protein
MQETGRQPDRDGVVAAVAQAGALLEEIGKASTVASSVQEKGCGRVCGSVVE